MLVFQQHQGSLEYRLLTIGIPQPLIKPVIAEWVKWEQCSGVEWTIKRLKGLKVDLIRSHSGLPMLTWVRKNRRGQIWGPHGGLFRWANKNEVNFSRAVQALMAYTFYIFSRSTEEQEKKFIAAVTSTAPTNLTPSFLEAFSKTVKASVHCCSVGQVEPLITFRGSPSKKSPRLFGRPSVHQDSSVLSEVEFFSTSGLGLLAKYPEFYLEQLKGLSVHSYYSWLVSNHRNNCDRFGSPPSEDFLGGEVHFLQEPGGKLRSVASPFRIHQRALAPLGNSLYRLVASLPWDCTFDQHRAHPFIQRHLSEGKRVHSVDLSSATDYFPLELQLTALRAIFGNQERSIDLFEEVSRSVWKSPVGDVKWTRGQPLGLYPSFAAFTLTHGLLLLHLAGSFKNQFFVVGDDVIILSDKLYDDYIAMLDRMACPWSCDKSISSSLLAEFAGKIVTPTRVIPQLKWRRLSDDNFLDIARLLGRRSRVLLTARQKRVFDALAHLCEPIGLNFSYPGSNLTKMVEDTIRFYQPEEVVLGSLMGLRRRMQEILHSSDNIVGDPLILEDIASTFDEKVKLALSRTVFNRWESSISIGLEGLETVPEAAGITSLPPKVVSPGRITTLERWERIIANRARL
jgi:hypothetical protein